MNQVDKEKLKIIKETADKLDVDPAPSLMLSLIGANPEQITKTLINQSNIKETDKAEKLNPKLELPGDYTEIAKQIHLMLIENTGSHMLDSGGAYGRHWEKNRHIQDFRTEYPLIIEIWDKEDYYFTLDVFSYLTSFLEVTEKSQELDKQFNEYSKDLNESWYSCMYSFIEYLKDNDIVTDSYSFNTYNGESMLSQVLQGIWFSVEGQDWIYGETYLMLQIHNGCDVRGGYTKPKIFHVPDPEYMLISDSDINARCDCGSIYSDDHGYDFYHGSGDLKPNNNKLPETWEIVEITENNQDQFKGYSNKGLRCKTCGKIPRFYPMLDY